jgi:hypothetical protein
MWKVDRNHLSAGGLPSRMRPVATQTAAELPQHAIEHPWAIRRLGLASTSRMTCDVSRR